MQWFKLPKKSHPLPQHSIMLDGQVNVITGIRRCEKTYLLRNLFRFYLIREGVSADHILSFELDLTCDIRYRNPLKLAYHVCGIAEKRWLSYIFLLMRSKCRTKRQITIIRMERKLPFMMRSIVCVAIKGPAHVCESDKFIYLLELKQRNRLYFQKILYTNIIYYECS